MQGDPRRKRLAALILGVALAVTFGIFVVSGAVGDPSIPDDGVAVVEEAPDGTVTQEEFDGGLRQAAFNLQLRELPPESDPQFEQVQQAALSNAIQSRWVRGEAEERGITVDDRDTAQALDTIINEQLGGQKGYERFLESSEIDGEPAFTEADVREVAELTAISNRLQEEALPTEPPDVSDADVELYYEANEEQFEVPESRDVRVILNPDPDEIDAALEELGDDPSAETWEQVARKYSTDEATKADGGLRRAVAEGQNEPALDEAIFSAEAGEVVGPIDGESGVYAIQVEEVTPAETTPLADVREQIVQTLQQGLQQQEVEAFQREFIEKWTSRTFCEDDLVVDLCANADAPEEPCPIDDTSEREQAAPEELDAGCPAPAGPRSVVNPATGSVFPGQQVPALAQGPYKPAPDPAAGLQPGAVPIGPDGAPVAPTGAPPGTAAPAP